MGLTEGQRDRIVTRINEVTQGGTLGAGCPTCGNRNWTLVDGFVSVATADLLGVQLSPPRYLPSVAVTCNQCGNTQLFNLNLLGLSDIASPTASSLPIPPPPIVKR